MTILFRMTDDPMIWTILRIICFVDFSRSSLWFWERNGFCSHKLIKYPLNIIIIKGIFLFLYFLKGNSSAFFLLLDIFVDISTISWPWVCFTEGGHWLSLLSRPFDFFPLRLCSFLTGKLSFYIACLRYEDIKVLRFRSAYVCSNLWV